MITSEQSEQLRTWFADRLPVDVYESLVEVAVDREEITVVGTLPANESVKAFRERTRQQRMEVAREAEELYRRKVAWAVESGDDRILFTHLAVPVMTRLRQPERQVLDTLVEGGVARSRADALAWCVRLVGRNTDEWLTELRDSLAKVREVREAGPDRGSDSGKDADSQKSGSE
ncbi:hypothetical protein ACFV7Q_24565 [Streptomyces sp. NPDC059851]|uniref:hypothetical protein n=1 Tax=Streptomyces sp. NPDC059851 TaxID=3346971 RepID=UPI00364B2E76